jgi:phage major head subunit gpT-like protein
MSLDTSGPIGISRGITAKLSNAMESYNPIFDRFVAKRSSVGRDEEYALAGNVAGMQELKGSIQYARLLAAKFTLVNKEFADGVEIPQVDFKDDRVGLYDDVVHDFGQAIVRHPDELLFNLCNNAASNECWDGQNFVDTDHEWGDSGPQSNKLTYNIAGSSNDPTPDECRAIVAAALTAICGFKRDNGLTFVGPTLQQLDGLVLLVPSFDLWQRFSAALYAITVSSGAQNYIVAKPAEVICCPGLTAADCVHLIRTGTPYQPFVYQEREVRAPWWNLEDAFKDPTLAYRLAAYARRNMGYYGWWNFVRVQMN